jgi:hypothetical protein
MTGGAVAACNEALTDRQASEAAVRIVTAGTTVMGIGGCADQGIVMTEGAACRSNLHQRAVVRYVESVGDFPRARMASSAVTAPGRESWLQVRNSRVTEGTIIPMRTRHRRIRGRSWVVTGRA